MNLMNLVIFNTGPVILKLILVVFAISSMYPFKFALINVGTAVTYFTANYVINEWRGKFFADKSKKDAGNSAKLVDSLLNFETVA